jgi:hypothetical protein
MIDISKVDKTKTARALIYIDFALGLCFACWAFAVYSSRIDWSDKKTAEEQGVYARLADTVKQLDAARGPAEARLQAARTAVAQSEELRPNLQKWYAEDLGNLRSGNKPVQAPVFAKDEMQLNKDGVPQMGPVLGPGDKPLRGLASIASLDQLYKQKLTEIQGVNTAIDELLAKQQRSSTDIGNGQAEGLRFELAGLNAKIKQAQDRQEILKPQVYNRQVELALLLKRQRALESRLKELQGTSVTE